MSVKRKEAETAKAVANANFEFFLKPRSHFSVEPCHVWWSSQPPVRPQLTWRIYGRLHGRPSPYVRLSFNFSWFYIELPLRMFFLVVMFWNSICLFVVVVGGDRECFSERWHYSFVLRADEPDWACGVCTYHNKGFAHYCEMCSSEKPANAAVCWVLV